VTGSGVREIREIAFFAISFLWHTFSKVYSLGHIVQVPSDNWELRVIETMKAKRDLRGAILVLAMILLVGVFAFVALTVDIGYMAVVKTQLQGAADAAVLGSAQKIPLGSSTVTASAQSLAASNNAAGKPVVLDSSDVELGFYDFSLKSSVVDPSSANAVRVTTRVQDQALFFAPIMGTDNFNQQATSIGMLNPRDIVFVVDLSGSMNDDTEPCWATDAVTEKHAPLG
jgi:Flp pilus assembly protein TadG